VIQDTRDDGREIEAPFNEIEVVDISLHKADAIDHPGLRHATEPWIGCLPTLFWTHISIPYGGDCPHGVRKAWRNV